MKYVLQVNTGNLTNKNYSKDEIINRLSYLFKSINVSKVIIGWNEDYELNKSLVNFIHGNHTEVYFWLPVFSEIVDFDLEDKYVEANIFKSNENTFSSGDNFEFVCQSSLKNIDYIVNKYKQIVKDIKFDGVFLDRIRYNSPAVNKNAIFGCLCDKCLEKYNENGIDIKALLNEDVYTCAIPSEFKEGKYIYSNENFNKLMTYKRDNITKQINELISRFNSMNLKVGLDSFALCFADDVGQDIVALSKKADFIKPMFYLKTTAPAGIPYELNGLGKDIYEKLKQIWNCDLNDINSSIKQCEYLLEKKVNITPGIDVNNIEGICASTSDYVEEYINNLKDIKLDEIVLSWNAMTIEDDLLDRLSKF